MSKPKLIIHELDCHGCGNIYYNGQFDNYAYDDSSWGDVRMTIESLIKIGFIDPNDVIIFNDNKEIYHLLDVAIENGLIAPKTLKERA